jgi:XTP/dITP diphosphohydrolase
MDTVRTVERAIAADRRGEDVPEVLDIASLGVIAEEEWRAFWPSADAEDAEPVEPVEDEPVEEDEPVAEVSTNGVEPVEEEEPVESQ